MSLVTSGPRYASVAEALEAQIRVGSDGRSEVVIDLSGVERISSEEINQLIRTYGIVRQSGCTLVIDNAHEVLTHVFALTRLDRLIKIRTTIGD